MKGPPGSASRRTYPSQDVLEPPGDGVPRKAERVCARPRADFGETSGFTCQLDDPHSEGVRVAVWQDELTSERREQLGRPAIRRADHRKAAREALEKRQAPVLELARADLKVRG